MFEKLCPITHKSNRKKLVIRIDPVKGLNKELLKPLKPVLAWTATNEPLHHQDVRDHGHQAIASERPLAAVNGQERNHQDNGDL